MPWDVTTAVNYAKTHHAKHSIGLCARYTRLAIEAGGVILGRHADAKDYGDSLKRVGFTAFSPIQVNEFLPGDIIIFEGSTKHPHGHMQIFDGKHWISDFQQHQLIPWKDKTGVPPYTVYRYQLLIDSNRTSSQTVLV